MRRGDEPMRRRVAHAGRREDVGTHRQAHASLGGTLASLEDVRTIALVLPESSERCSRGRRQWLVREKLFVWERPLRASELETLTIAPPTGVILGARVEHLLAKEALLASEPHVFFTTAHFDGYPAVLVRMERISPAELNEVVVEAWLCRAPKRVAERYAAEHLAP